MEKGNYDDTGKKKNCPTCRPKKMCQKIVLSRYKANETYFTNVFYNCCYGMIFICKTVLWISKS